MGWTHCFTSPYAVYTLKGATMPPTSRKKEIDRMLTWEHKDADGCVTSSSKVLKSSMVGSVYYGAIAISKPGKEDKVMAAVFLTCGKTRHDGTIWGYKDMDEGMLPYQFDCPAGILSLLTPTDNERANEWRNECRKKLLEKARIRKGNKSSPFLPSGVEVREERSRWIFNSANYQTIEGYRYCGVAYRKRLYHEYTKALEAFLYRYGTAQQKAEYAAKGFHCPSNWKGMAA